jgi:DNA ligase-1
MTIEGSSNFKVWLFDYVNPENDIIEPFMKRLKKMPTLPSTPFEYEILYGSLKNTIEEVEDFEKICLLKGYEGVMLRSPSGTYKFGRSTINDNILLKLKRFEDSEAILIDIEEKMSNQNPEKLDAFGYIKRSSALDGMISMNTTGALIVKDEHNQFKIGSGLDDKMREEIWNNKSSYIGKIVKYKYFPVGVKELPRHPVFLGFRDKEDF